MKLIKQRYHFLCIFALAATGCNKASDPPPAPQPQIDSAQEADDKAAEERAARAHLTASTTDAQILRAIGVDPASVKLKPAPEGYGGDDYIKTA